MRLLKSQLVLKNVAKKKGKKRNPTQAYKYNHNLFHNVSEKFNSSINIHNIYK